MRRSLNRRAGVDRRLPTFVGMSGFQDYAINIVVLVSFTNVADTFYKFPDCLVNSTSCGEACGQQMPRRCRRARKSATLWCSSLAMIGTCLVHNLLLIIIILLLTLSSS